MITRNALCHVSYPGVERKRSLETLSPATFTMPAFVRSERLLGVIRFLRGTGSTREAAQNSR